MTNFAVTNIILAVLWTLTNFILVKFIETPHVNKIYGKTKRVSGVGKTLLGLKPLRQVSDIVNRIENIIIKSLVDEKQELQWWGRTFAQKIIKITKNGIS
ncbi:ALI_collapsed_G0024440.mRNA.1.CDS.1 [Saccharomyces cerevisiae]|nr:ALI_collapsed_G0024440.mRNA.1.CDS.1 [Saccharomyces cerevisiae]